MFLCKIKFLLAWIVDFTNRAANGATFYINRVALYKMDWEYQYSLSDQLGSPRVVLQTNPGVVTMTATMEPENFTKENEQFLNLVTTIAISR